MPDLTYRTMNAARRRNARLTALFTLGAALLLLSLGMIAFKPLPAAAQSEPTPFPLFAFPDARLSAAVSSNTLALGKDNRTLVAANSFDNSISVIELPQGRLKTEIAVGLDPRSVALTGDGFRAVSANRGDGTLSLVDLASAEVVTIRLGGVNPYGVVVGDGDMAYVSLQGSSAIVEVSLLERRVTRYFSVPEAPSGLALWGDFLYVTHFWSGDLTLVYIPDGRVARTLKTGIDTGLSQAVELDITRGLAYLPQTRSNADNPALTYDSVVFPIVNQVDLRNLSLVRTERIALDIADRPVNMPFALALDRFRQWLYVANAGTNDVSVIDLNTGLARAHLEVGTNPRGILLNRDNSLLFVNNALEGTLTIIETRNLTVLDTLPITDFNVPVDTIVAAELFFGADDPRMSYGGWVSCANCHFDGLSDGRVWQGFPDGPRNTPGLFGLADTPPYNWSATWDEPADAELKIRSLQFGSGLIDSPTVSPALGDPHAGRSIDLDSLTAYLASFTGPSNPFTPDGSLVQRGAVVFAEQNCAQCHAGTAGTDSQRYDVGTGASPLERAGSTFDTPSLRWLWASAPYFHDGSAATLRDVFILPGAHQLIRTLPLEDIDALVTYLLALPQ